MMKQVLNVLLATMLLLDPVLMFSVDKDGAETKSTHQKITYFRNGHPKSNSDDPPSSPVNEFLERVTCVTETIRWFVGLFHRPPTQISASQSSSLSPSATKSVSPSGSVLVSEPTSNSRECLHPPASLFFFYLIYGCRVFFH